jgi:hypothetical protein
MVNSTPSVLEGEGKESPRLSTALGPFPTHLPIENAIKDGHNDGASGIYWLLPGNHTIAPAQKGDNVKIGKIAVGIGVLLCLGSLSLMAQTVRVGGESLRANGQIAQGFQYTGPCPVDLKFSWGLISTGPTTVNYHFVRSDGGHSANGQAVNIPQGNRSVPVYYDWHLGANTPKFANFAGSVQLVIDSPNPVQGNIKFTLHCQ